MSVRSMFLRTLLLIVEPMQLAFFSHKFSLRTVTIIQDDEELSVSNDDGRLSNSFKFDEPDKTNQQMNQCMNE